MLEYGSPAERAEARMKAADAARDAKALGALAADMASIPSHVVPPCSCENTDAALGLPLEDAEPFDEMTGPMGHVLPGGYIMPSKANRPHDGRTPGTTTPSRTDAALSFDDYERARDAEFKAYTALLNVLKTHEQIEAAAAYSSAVLRSRQVLAAVRIGGAA